MRPDRAAPSSTSLYRGRTRPSLGHLFLLPTLSAPIPTRGPTRDLTCARKRPAAEVFGNRLPEGPATRGWRRDPDDGPAHREHEEVGNQNRIDHHTPRSGSRYRCAPTPWSRASRAREGLRCAQHSFLSSLSPAWHVGSSPRLRSSKSRVDSTERAHRARRLPRSHAQRAARRRIHHDAGRWACWSCARIPYLVRLCPRLSGCPSGQRGSCSTSAPRRRCGGRRARHRRPQCTKAGPRRSNGRTSRSRRHPVTYAASHRLRAEPAMRW